MRTSRVCVLAGAAVSALLFGAPPRRHGQPTLVTAALKIFRRRRQWSRLVPQGAIQRRRTVVGFSSMILRSSITLSITKTSRARRCTVSASTLSRSRWLRFDVTGEYRGKQLFLAQDSYNPAPAVWLVTAARTNTADLESWLGLVNAYIDLGTFRGLTPYVGGGMVLQASARASRMSRFHSQRLLRRQG